MSRGVSPREFEAYQERSRNGDVCASFWVAYCYNHDTGGVAYQNTERSIQVLNRVIDTQNHNNTQDMTGKHRFLLGDLLQSQNPRKARQLFRQAVPRLRYEAHLEDEDGGFDSREAASYLGSCLFHGYHRGNDNDSTFTDGNGTREDRLEGIHWRKIAAEQGHAEAKEALAFWFFQKLYTDEEQSSVLDWWLGLASKEDHPCYWAQRSVGQCYEQGIGVEKDIVEAVGWYDTAITNGDRDSFFLKNAILDQLRYRQHELDRVLGCVQRNQNIKIVRKFIRDNCIPLGFWAVALGVFQQQENPPWEAPSPTFLVLQGIVPQLCLERKCCN